MPKIAKQWLRETLRVLYQRRTVTRADVIEETGLNPASVSHCLRFLIDRGAIVKVGELRSQGGRRREVISLNGEAAYFVAVDLEGRTIRFGLANLAGDIRYRWEDDLEYGQPLPVQKILDGIQRVLRNLTPPQRDRIVAVGVSYPGLRDRDGRITAFNLGWQNFTVAEELEAALPFPVFLEHDKHSCVLAERWLGCAQGYSNGLFLIVERGIGLGVFVNGKPIHGARDMVGEIGHCKVESAADLLCNCGAKGCLETIASSGSIVRQYIARSNKNGSELQHIRVSDVFERARRGDADARFIVERAGRGIGKALASAVSLLNPEIIVLGGDLINAEDLLLPLIRDELERGVMPMLLEGLEIKPSVLGVDIRLKGAASLAFRRSLSDPALLAKICQPVVGDHEGHVGRPRVAAG